MMSLVLTGFAGISKIPVSRQVHTHSALLNKQVRAAMADLLLTTHFDLEVSRLKNTGPMVGLCCGTTATSVLL
jgi:hypothetical protein